jgi:hypothetical protein
MLFSQSQSASFGDENETEMEDLLVSVVQASFKRIKEQCESETETEGDTNKRERKKKIGTPTLAALLGMKKELKEEFCMEELEMRILGSEEDDEEEEDLGSDGCGSSGSTTSGSGDPQGKKGKRTRSRSQVNKVVNK